MPLQRCSGPTRGGPWTDLVRLKTLAETGETTARGREARLDEVAVGIDAEAPLATAVMAAESGPEAAGSPESAGEAIARSEAASLRAAERGEAPGEAGTDEERGAQG